MSSNAELLLNKLKDNSYKQIKRMISEPQVENLWIDFKCKEDRNINVKASISDKTNFAKALSGFTNASGGLLIWGIDARKDSEGIFNYSEQAISNVSSFRQQLESLLPDAVSRIPEGIEIFTILIPVKAILVF